MKLSSGCLVYHYINGELHFLLVRGSGHAARWGYGVPKGLVDPNESKKKAARRETTEEAGVRVGKLQYIGKVIMKTKEVICYLAQHKNGRINPDTLSTNHDWEISVSKFFPAKEAHSIANDHFKPIIAKAIKMLPKKVEGSGWGSFLDPLTKRQLIMPEPLPKDYFRKENERRKKAVQERLARKIMKAHRR